MTHDAEFEVLAAALKDAGLYDEKIGRRYCLIRRPEGGFHESSFLHLWETRPEAEEFLNRLPGPGRWRIFEADVIPIYEILDRNGLNLPARPKVVSIRPELYRDSFGEDGLRVWVLLDDRTPAGERTWESLRPIDEAIHSALRESLVHHGVQIWPNVWFRTESEYAEEAHSPA